MSVEDSEVPDAILSDLHLIVLAAPSELDTIIIPIFSEEELRFRELVTCCISFLLLL